MKKKYAILSDYWCAIYGDQTLEREEYLRNRVQDKPCPDADKILDYLYSGALISEAYVVSKRGESWKEPDEGFRTIHYTDGVWVWDNLLIDFVRYKNFRIDDEFVQHMRENQWQVPEIDMNDPKTYES